MRCFGILGSVQWQFLTDVSGQHIGSIFKGQGCPKTSAINYHSTLCKIPEESRSHLHAGRSLKSRTERLCSATFVGFWRHRNESRHTFKKATIISFLMPSHSLSMTVFCILCTSQTSTATSPPIKHKEWTSETCLFVTSLEFLSFWIWVTASANKGQWTEIEPR
jgi:hypothetical protein